MRPYEVGFIIQADLTQEEISEQVDNVKSWIERNEGEILFVDRWGRRRLAYPIESNRDGYYVFMKTKMPGGAPREIERVMRLSEPIIRYIVLREDQ